MDILETLLIVLIIAIVFGFTIGLYFLPTIIALSVHNSNALAIFLLNFFTGWTGLGWIGSLIWAVIV